MTTQQRTHIKMERIKQTALELFAAHGLDKVSMDEIAAKADVSKVTIYKYFGSKEQLYAEVINLFGEKTLVATAEILSSDMEFLNKLRAVLALQIHSAQWIDFDYLFQIWDDDAGRKTHEGIQSRVRALMQQFFEEGQRAGYINTDITFETLDLYADIFRAGMRTRLQSAPLDPQTLEELYRLYFFGFVNRK